MQILSCDICHCPVKKSTKEDREYFRRESLSYGFDMLDPLGDYMEDEDYDLCQTCFAGMFQAFGAFIRLRRLQVMKLLKV